MNATTENSPIDLGSKLDALADLRDRKKEINAELTDVSQAYTELEREIIDLLDQQGTRMTGSARFRASISESTVPTVTDWDAFYAYVIANESPYMFERRVSASAWRELVESGEPVPGTEPFTRRSLSLRKV